MAFLFMPRISRVAPRGRVSSQSRLRLASAPFQAFRNLTLPRSKGRTRSGQVETVVVSDPVLVRWDCSLFSTLPASALVLPYTYSQFRTRFNILVRDVGLPSGTWSSHSLRRGGATHLFRCSASLDRVTMHGRWASVRTARIYISEAVAVATSIRSTAAQSALISQWGIFLQRRLAVFRA